MDIDTLLQQTAEAPPCGPNLEYSPDFLALEQAARPKGEQVFGDTVVPGAEVDWNDVRERAEALLGRSKDLRVAMVLLRALARTADLPGFAAGLTLVNGLLDRYWDTVHPQLEAAEGNDPTMRMSALAGLAPSRGAGGDETVFADLRGALVVPRGPWGVLSVRDVLVAAGKLAAGGTQPTLGTAEIDAIVRGAAAADPVAASAARSALDAATRMQTMLTDRVGAEKAPDLQPLRDILKLVSDTVARAAAPPGEGPATVEDSAEERRLPRVAGEIRSREDALKALDNVCAFLERTEPTNPAPLLIRRAQRIMSKTFVEIVEDLAPDGLAQVRAVAGIRGE